MKFRVLYFVAVLLIIIACPLFQVSEYQLEDGSDSKALEVEPSPVDTLCIFLNNSDRLFLPGEECTLSIELKNNGNSELVIIAIFASVHPPNDSDHLVYQLRPQTFTEKSVEPSAIGTLSYSFVLDKYLEAGKYDMVGTILYFKDDTPFYATFFKGSIILVETPFMLVAKATIFIILVYCILLLLQWVCAKLCAKLYQKWEDIMAKRAQKKAEAEAAKAREEARAEAARKRRENFEAAMQYRLIPANRVTTKQSTSGRK